MAGPSSSSQSAGPAPVSASSQPAGILLLDAASQAPGQGPLCREGAGSVRALSPLAYRGGNLGVLGASIGTQRLQRKVSLV